MSLKAKQQEENKKLEDLLLQIAKVIVAHFIVTFSPILNNCGNREHIKKL